MPPFQKYGLILLACFLFVVVFANLFASENLNLSNRIPIQSFLPDYFQYYNKLYSTSVNSSRSSGIYDVAQLPETELAAAEQVVLSAYITAPPELLRSSQIKSFAETFQAFPWTEFETVAADKNRTKECLAFSELFIDELTYFLELEPLIPIDEDCQPPPLPLPNEINCSKFPKAFNGTNRTEPIKIGTLVQFGFDVDILEIHLNELFGIVDKIFIIESTQAHFRNVKKPLMWERVKLQERFKKFPVVHLIIDDAEGTKAEGKIWSMERLQERLRWQKFVEWNDATKYFNDEDIIGFGDADEIPSRAKLHMLKYCELGGDSVDFGIWFPYGHINQAFQTDFPIRGHPLTLGDPTYYKLKSARAYANKKPSDYPNRRRGGSRNYLLGGTHMTHYGYLPHQLVKHATATEGGLATLAAVQKLSSYLKIGEIRRMELDLGATPKSLLQRIQPVNLNNLTAEMKEVCVLPWFYNCNKNRYPVWEGGHDTRLGILLQ